MSDNIIYGGAVVTPIAPEAIRETIVDQRYDSNSENAQSGIAVAEALNKVAVIVNKTDTIITTADNESSFVKNDVVVNVKRDSKNLIPFNNNAYATANKTENGLTFKVNSDGTVLVTCSNSDSKPTANTFFILAYNFPIKKGMVISGAPANSNNETYEVQAYKDSVNHITTNAAVNKPVATTDYVANVRIAIRSTCKIPSSGLIFAPQIEYGTVATLHSEPSSDRYNLTDFKVKRYYNKNLSSINEIYLTDVKPNAVLFDGKATGTFTLSCDMNTIISDMALSPSAGLFKVDFWDKATQAVTINYMKNGPFTFSGTIKNVALANWCTLRDCTIKDIQLEVGSKATPFEPSSAETIYEENNIAANRIGTTLYKGNTSGTFEVYLDSHLTGGYAEVDGPPIVEVRFTNDTFYLTLDTPRCVSQGTLTKIRFDDSSAATGGYINVVAKKIPRTTEYTVSETGVVEDLKSLDVDSVLISDHSCALIDCNYNVDTKDYVDKKFAELSAALLNS